MQHSVSADRRLVMQELFQAIAEALAAGLGGAAATPRPPGLSPVAARLGSPRSHSIVLSPDSSPPSRPGAAARQSSCC
jgi:hypothetical protein